MKTGHILYVPFKCPAFDSCNEMLIVFKFCHNQHGHQKVILVDHLMHQTGLSALQSVLKVKSKWTYSYEPVHYWLGSVAVAFPDLLIELSWSVS